MLGLAPLWTEAASTGVSGREVFPGITVGQYVYGATFAGWSTADKLGRSEWYPITQATGDAWQASVTYRGDARVPGHSVQVVDGLWSLGFRENGYAGTVLSGAVHWPAGENVPQEWPCWSSGYTSDGYPVATFDAVLSVAGSAQRGRMRGCLDDIHWKPGRPLRNIPRVWGTMTIDGRPDRAVGLP